MPYEKIRGDGETKKINTPIHVQRALCKECNIQCGTPDQAQRVSHDTVRRCSSETRETIRFATYLFLHTVRALPDPDECTCQRGQWPRTCRGLWEALWDPDGRGGGVSIGAK